jgi:hypothetical protein
MMELNGKMRQYNFDEIKEGQMEFVNEDMARMRALWASL